MLITKARVGSAALLVVCAASASSHAEVVYPGVLARDPADHCTVLSNPELGSIHMLDNLAPFSLGDTVVVTADSETQCDCDHHDSYPCLHNNTIAPNRDFDLGCGRLEIDDEYGCGFLISSRFGVVALASYTGFAQGDSIHVTGRLRFDCTAIPECAGDPCLAANSVSGCLTPIRAVTWGSLRNLYR